MEQKQDTMVTEQSMPGDFLKAAREQRSLTVNSVAQSLNLSSEFISLIERNEFASLPASVYLKGYVRMYARLLDLDDQEVIAKLNQYVDVDALFSQRESYTNYACPVTLSAPSTIRLKRKKQHKRRKWLTALVCTTLSLAAAYWVWHHYSAISQQSAKPITQNKHIDFN